MKKINIYIIVIIFLVATNLGTLLSIRNSSNQDILRNETIAKQTRPERMGFFFNEMGFSDEQIIEIEKHNRKYNIEAGSIAQELNGLRHEIVREVSSENQDTENIEDIIENFGIKHAQLKRETVNFYNNLASVADSSQRERLEFLFRDMLNPDGVIYGRGRGRSLEARRGGPQQGRGRRSQNNPGRGRNQPTQ